MDFMSHWKQWLRPLVMSLYIILMFVAIPLCAVEVATKDDKHVKAWFTGGVFVMMSVPISLWEILQHIINYTQPHLQKHIIRIMWMVPIYALNAWFALRFKESAIYLDTIRECYEAYVIYNFMAYLLSYLWTSHPQLHLDLKKKPQQKHLIPFCCLRPWKMGNHIIINCKHGVLQYTILRPITTAIALICELCGVYSEGEIEANSAWIYLTVINNFSQIWAMYCLVLFYKATSDMLAPIKPIPKFLCVKFVVFFSFWQAVVIAILNVLGLLPATDFYNFDTKEMATALQDFIICIEMFFAAIAHYYSFSHEPFVDTESQPEGNCCQSFMSMWDISDVRADFVEHVKVVGSTMKKTVSKPFLGGSKSTESTPLLSSSVGQAGDPQSVKVTVADVHPPSGYQADTMSSTSEWDVTSVDRYQSSSQFGRSTTASMHNFLDMSNSVEDQHVSSDSNVRVKDTNSLRQKPSVSSSEDISVTEVGVKQDSDEKKGATEQLPEETDEKSLIDFGSSENVDTAGADRTELGEHEQEQDQPVPESSESSSGRGDRMSTTEESNQNKSVIDDTTENPVC